MCLTSPCAHTYVHMISPRTRFWSTGLNLTPDITKMNQNTGLQWRNYVPISPINYMLKETHDKIHDQIWAKNLTWKFNMKMPEH